MWQRAPSAAMALVEGFCLAAERLAHVLAHRVPMDDEDAGASDGAQADRDRALLLTCLVPLSDMPVCAKDFRDEIVANLSDCIALIDALINSVLNAVLHHPRFARLEGVWRGIDWLVRTASHSTRENVLTIRVLDVSWPDLAEDLIAYDEPEDTQLYRLLYIDEFDQSGGRPFSVVLSDHAIEPGYNTQTGLQDVEALTRASKVAAASFCPLIFGMSPRMAGVETIQEIARRRHLEEAFASEQMEDFRRFQARDTARYIGMVGNRCLMRDRYGIEVTRRVGTGFRESAPTQMDQLPWAPASFAVGHCLAKAIVNFRWPAAIYGAVTGRYAKYNYTVPLDPEGGTLTELPEFSFELDRDSRVPWVKYPLEVVISHEQEGKLAAAGFIFPRPCQYTPYVAYRSCPSAFRIGTELTDADRISTSLPAVFSVCRFVHIVNALARQWIGAVTTAQELEGRLNNWLSKYRTSVVPRDPADAAERPLQDAQVRVEAVDGQQGFYRARIDLKPHFQLEELASNFQVETVLSRRGAE